MRISDWSSDVCSSDLARAKPAGCPPMPIMAARLYDKGKLVRDLGPDEAIPDECAEGEFFWLGLYEPTPGELERVAQRFGLHPLAVEDALKANQLPKADVYGDQLFVIARTANLDGDTIQPGRSEEHPSEI